MMERKMNRAQWMLCTSIIVIFATHSFAQDRPLWGKLKEGPYSVGFQTVSKYDVSRPFKRKINYEGVPYKGERARPLQISIWYPTAKNASATAMLFEDYIFLTSKELTFGQITEKDKQDSISAFLQSPNAREADQAKLKEILKFKTASQMNAAPVSQKFPLVLIAQSIGISSPYGNSILAEYLASNGYVVASSPGMGETSRQLTYDPIGIGAQMEDMQFIIRLLRERGDVDPDRLALVGFSFGGLAAAVLTMNNTDVDAFVSLDSSVANKWAYSQVFQSSYFQPNNLRVPVVHITAQEPNEGTDFAFFKSLKYSNVTYVKLKGMRAIDFSSLGMVSAFVPKFGGESKGDSAAGQVAICQYTLKFLDAVVKKNPEAQKFLQSPPSQNGFTSEFVMMENKPGFKAPPSEEEFVQILQQKGIGEASTIFAQVKKDNSEYQIFEPETLNALAGEALDKKNTKEAIEILKLNSEAYTNEWETFDLMGMAYMQEGNSQLAIENFTKSLDLNPENTNAAEMLQKLQKP
jgi:hypothetical protein